MGLNHVTLKHEKGKHLTKQGIRIKSTLQLNS